MSVGSFLNNFITGLQSGLKTGILIGNTVQEHRRRNDLSQLGSFASGTQRSEGVPLALGDQIVSNPTYTIRGTYGENLGTVYDPIEAERATVLHNSNLLNRAADIELKYGNPENAALLLNRSALYRQRAEELANAQEYKRQEDAFNSELFKLFDSSIGKSGESNEPFYSLSTVTKLARLGLKYPQVSKINPFTLNQVIANWQKSGKDVLYNELESAFRTGKVDKEALKTIYGQDVDVKVVEGVQRIPNLYTNKYEDVPTRFANIVDRNGNVVQSISQLDYEKDLNNAMTLISNVAAKKYDDYIQQRHLQLSEAAGRRDEERLRMARQQQQAQQLDIPSIDEATKALRLVPNTFDINLTTGKEQLTPYGQAVYSAMMDAWRRGVPPQIFVSEYNRISPAETRRVSSNPQTQQSVQPPPNLLEVLRAKRLEEAKQNWKRALGLE